MIPSHLRNCAVAIGLALCCCLSQAFAAPPDAKEAGQEVTIPDPGLEAALRAALEKPTGPLLDTELATLTELNAAESEIEDLGGIEFCINLQSAYLYGNQITDLSPLDGLTQLNYLTLDYNQISDLSPLAELTQLSSLSFFVNQISDMSPLAGLTQLYNLNLGGNDISDLSPLAGLTQLSELFLNFNQVSDLSPLAGLTQLSDLSLGDNQISDLSPLVANEAIAENTYVNVSGNPLSESACTEQVPALRQRGAAVNIGDTCIETGAVVNIPDPALEAAIRAALGIPELPLREGGLTSLYYLYASDAGITDLTGIEYCINLQTADLGFNQISDLSPLASLTQLASFELNRNQITDLSPLAALTQLNDLNLDDNQITDLSPLAGLTQLSLLRLGINQISDLSPLAGLTQLSTLDLNNNQIWDLSPLVVNEAIAENTYVEVSDNPLAELACIEQIAALRQRGVEVYARGACNNIGAEISIPDPALEAALRAALDIPEEPLREGLLASLTFLSARGVGIVDLNGIEYCINLQTAELDFNQISDLSPLAGLTQLNNLDLSGNQLCDMTILLQSPGIGNGDSVNVSNNPLRPAACVRQIPMLAARGASVASAGSCDGNQGDCRAANPIAPLPTLYVEPLTGSDGAGAGTFDAPLGTIQAALDHAGTYATEEAPVTVRLGAGVFRESLVFPPHVRLAGANPADADESVLLVDDLALSMNNNAGVRMAEGALLQDLTVELDEEAEANGATLVVINSSRAALDNVILYGRSRTSSVGVQALNEASSDSTVTRCVFRGLTFGVRAIDTAITVSRNTFEVIEDDAVVVLLPEAKGAEALTPELGTIEAQSETGYNEFEFVADRFINNLSEAQTVAQVNDWGLYEAPAIRAKMNGDATVVEFEPFLVTGQLAVTPSLFVTLLDADTGLPIQNAALRVTPGSIPLITRNVLGVYNVPFITTGNYAIAAEAPGYLSGGTNVNVAPSSGTAIEATVELEPDPETPPRVLPERHTADADDNGRLDLAELLRGIQLFNGQGIRCLAGTEDGYALGIGGDKTCPPHVADYNPADWRFSLSELLRMIQFFNNEAYRPCNETEDGYCPGAQ